MPDDGDAVTAGGGNPNHTWSTTVTYTAINAAWSSQIGSFTGFGGATFDPGRPFNESTFGRVATITLDGTSGSITIPGTEFYVDLGLKSDLFTVTSTDGTNASISGQGWGHGIGMGQWGALGYAIGQDNGDGNWTYQQIVNHYYGPATLGSLPGGTSLVGDQPSGGVGGYWVNATDGGIFSFGNAQFYGSTGGMRLNQPVVAIASTHDAAGYWEVASDGGVFSFGDAQFHGSTGSIRLNKPMVGMATTPDGGGYWLVASDGGIFAYGDAQFYGSTGSLRLNKPVIGMVPTHDGGGYWLIASDGGLFAYGDAAVPRVARRSTPPPTPIVGVAPSPDGGGYWMLEANGTSHAFGDAPSVGLLGQLASALHHEEPHDRPHPRLQRAGVRCRQRQRAGLRLRRCALLRGRRHRRARLLRPCRRHRRHARLSLSPGPWRRPRPAAGSGAADRAGPGVRRPHRGPPR